MLTEIKCILTLIDPLAYMSATNKVQQNKLLIFKSYLSPMYNIC